jgi:RimJ/RimL family protein N-acetyltransferase
MPENILIRAATVSDASAIVNAEKQIARNPGLFVSLPHELNEQNVIRTIKAFEASQTGIYLVAEINGKIVGHAFLAPLHLKSICHVCNLTIGVHEGWQEKGVGSALMHRLIEWAKNSDHIEKIELNVRASNTRAIALYKKMGFVEEGRLKNRIKIPPDQYIDDILMALDVT